jgi:LacI family transcriptional regulator
VFVDRVPGKLTADSVVQDDVGGGREATAHLISHGHRRIAFMGDDVITGILRLKGCKEALADAGLAHADELVHLGDVDTLTVTAALRRILAEPDPPTAVFSSNARCTVSVVSALQALRRNDIAIIGFGDFPTAAALVPAITVIDQDGEEMGRFAAERLFDRLDDPGRKVPRRTVLPVALVTRSSCAMPGEKLGIDHGG